MTDRGALVTGVSRRVGIGAAVGRRLAASGHRLLLSGLPAYDQEQPFGADPEGLDRHLVVNIRATMLLIDAFAKAHDAGAGRVVLFSSGQRLGPMVGELAYAVSKAAVENLTRQLGTTLMRRNITINCVNPGPTDTGWATPELLAGVAQLFPGGAWGQPDDAARLVDWLCSPDARWVTGQVIDSEGGFDRYA